MKKILKSIFLIFIILFSINNQVYANEKFDEEFFNMNDIIYYDAGERCIEAGGGSSTLVGGSIPEQIWNFLKAEGFSDESTAGIMGNFYAESIYDPSKIQNNGAGPAAGLAQWESWSAKSGRWLNMSNYAKEKGKDWTDLQSQLEWVIKELEGADPTTVSKLSKYGGIDGLKKMTDIRKAVEAFEISFERAGTPRWEVRYQAAEEAYATFKGSSSTSSGSGKYTFIGDSITVGVKAQLESTFNGSLVNAYIGRGISSAGSSGDSVLDFINNNQSSLTDTIVFNIGTNDNFPVDKAKEMLEKVKGKKVYIVNSFALGGSANFETINQNIKSAISGYNNVKVLDWKSHAESNGGRESLYESDGYHYNTAGKSSYIEFLQKSLGNSSGSGNSCSGGSLGSGSTISERAIELAWPENQQNRAYSFEITDKQKEALTQTNLINYGDSWVRKGASCDAFVSMVMSTTVDKEYAKYCCGVVNLSKYMRDNPDKYEKIEYNGTTSNMQPGDIIAAGTGGGPAAHIEIYVKINGEDKVANGGYSRTTGVIEPMNLSIMESLGPVEVFRWKG